MVFILSILLSGCCRNDIPPILDSPRITQSLADESLNIPLDVIVIDSSLSLDDLEFNVVSSNPEIETSISDGWLRISPTTTPYNGTSDISISVTDKCEQVSTED